MQNLFWRFELKTKKQKFVRTWESSKDLMFKGNRELSKIQKLNTQEFFIDLPALIKWCKNDLS